MSWVFRLPRTRYPERGHYRDLVTVVYRIRLALGLIVFSLAVGTVGYRIIEGAHWFDAYYMSVITLSTIGYGEVVPLSTAGRFFNSLLIVFNLGAFAYALSSITSIFADGGLKMHMNEYDMSQNISQLRNHTIVCGFGRHALLTCEELSKQNIPFVVIEIVMDKIEEIRKGYPYLFIAGDATDDDILTEAGIVHAAAIVITLPADANNLFIVMSARQLNPRLRIISRANQAHDEVKLKRAGADHVVFPEKIGGFYMANLVSKPDLVEFFNLVSNMGPGQIVFEELPVHLLKKQYQMVSLGESQLAQETKMPVVAVRYANGRYQLNPPPDTLLAPNMDIVVFGDQEQMAHFKEVALGGA
jgi:voltage-gated potassium channel